MHFVGHQDSRVVKGEALPVQTHQACPGFVTSLRTVIGRGLQGLTREAPQARESRLQIVLQHISNGVLRCPRSRPRAPWWCGARPAVAAARSCRPTARRMRRYWPLSASALRCFLLRRYWAAKYTKREAAVPNAAAPVLSCAQPAWPKMHKHRTAATPAAGPVDPRRGRQIQTAEVFRGYAPWFHAY